MLVNLTSALAAELIVRFLLTGEKRNYLVLRDARKIVPKELGDLVRAVTNNDLGSAQAFHVADPEQAIKHDA